ncbi:MAG: Radical domain protein [Bacteroidetes bacterium]|jgi:MoaA/NifB/PqqE/SkfB family radical SAM enzyme|nr:Radical domain protein [Bacteroidota bacterium]
MFKQIETSCSCGATGTVNKNLEIPLEKMACTSCGKENYVSNYYKMDIALSEFCNLKCQMCRRPSYAVFMDKDWCKSVMTEAAAIGIKVISFSGGEPFVHKGIWEILDHAFSLGLKIQLVTNGTLLRKEHIPVLEKLDCCTVSLDGMRDNHDKIRGKKGSWDRTIKTLEMYAESNIQWGTNTVIQKDNFTEIKELFNHIQKIGGNKYSYCGFSNVELVPETLHLALNKDEEKVAYEQLLAIKEDAQKTHTWFNDDILLTKYFQRFADKNTRVRPHGGCTLPTRFIGFSAHGFYPCWHIGKALKQKSLIEALMSPEAKEIVSSGLCKTCVGCNTFNYSWDEEWVNGVMKSFDTNENISYGVVALPNPFEEELSGATSGNTIDVEW